MKYLIGLFAILFLSGCATFQDYRYEQGMRDGKSYCKKGYKETSLYYRGFYEGFLLQNLKNRYEE